MLIRICMIHHPCVMDCGWDQTMPNYSRRKMLASTAATSIFVLPFSEGQKAKAAPQKSNVVRPEDWGAVGDGDHDDTKAIQSAIDHAAKGQVVLLTGKIYKVSGDKTGILKIPPSGLQLRGQGARKPTILCVTDPAYILRGDAVHNVNISNIGFEGPDARCIGIWMSGAASNIRISDCTAKYCGLYNGTTFATSYAEASKGNSPSDVQIQNCIGTGNPKVNTNSAFITVQYHTNVRIDNCQADGYDHGIMWWGGDSNYQKNGAPQAERKTSDITITNCRISNIRQGGIWGSMGRNVKVVNCTVDTCGDVGFDAEGCQDVTFSGGKVRNCKNGCLTTFWGASNIVFQNVDVEVSASFPLAFRSYNATLKAALSESASIIGGTITCPDGIGRIDQGSGPLDNFLMRGTHLKNVIVNMTQRNIHNITIDGITAEFTRQAPNKSGDAVINIGNLQQNGRERASGIVRNCEIISSMPQPGLGDCAISFTGADVNTPSFFSAEGNKISGFGTAISVADSAGRSTYQLKGNQLGRGAIKRTGLSGRSVLNMR